MTPDKPDNKVDIYNVTRLNREVRSVLEGSFPPIWVQGEISNLASPASGHLYFSLKDAYSQVRCAMFRGRNRNLTFRPENGTEVLLRASVSLYETRGEFQLLVDYMEPAGAGALQRAFEELKQKLFAEGLFDESHKKPLPLMVQRIGVVTSPTGAAIRDILTVLGRRFPLAGIILYPSAVQGDAAAEQIIDMLQTAERRNECDVIILARGGGSLEDLWAFNNEQLARAIHACRIPLVTGIGHEIDTTIADFVADHRAATPSAAAETVSPDQQQLLNTLRQFRNKLVRDMQHVLNQYHTHTRQLEKRLPHPARIMQMIQQRLDDLNMRSRRAISTILEQKRLRLSHMKTLLAGQNPKWLITQQYEQCERCKQSFSRLIRTRLQQMHTRIHQLAHNLDTVSPLATLGRGYSIVRAGDGRIIRQAGELSVGEKVRALFSKGQADCIVDRIYTDKDRHRDFSSD